MNSRGIYLRLPHPTSKTGTSQRHRETGVTYATPVLPETSYTFLYRKKLSHGASGQDGLHMIDLLL